MHGLVRLADFPALNIGLDVLSLAECSLHNHFTFIELCLVLMSERAELESRVAEVHLLEQQARAAEEDSEAPRAGRLRVNELTAEHA